MGACGCGDYGGGFKFPGPEGITYVLEVYPGCRDCHTPAGVVIHRFTAEDSFWHEHDRAMPFHMWGESGSGEFAHPIFDPAAAIARFKAEIGYVKAEGDYGTVGDLIEDEGSSILRDAIHDTLIKFEKDLKKRTRKDKDPAPTT